VVGDGLCRIGTPTQLPLLAPPPRFGGGQPTRLGSVEPDGVPSTMTDKTGEVMRPIDRIAHNGDIREHLTKDGERTICGLDLTITQEAGGNRPCLRCKSIKARQENK